MNDNTSEFEEDADIEDAYMLAGHIARAVIYAHELGKDPDTIVAMAITTWMDSQGNLKRAFEAVNAAVDECDGGIHARRRSEGYRQALEQGQKWLDSIQAAQGSGTGPY